MRERRLWPALAARLWPALATALWPALAAALAGLGLVLVVATPAAAHPAGVQPALDFRTSVHGLDPAVAGLTVRFVADGSRLELTNATGRTVEVAGYEAEPLLQVRPDGVWQNTRSPSLYIDQPTNPAAARADAAAAPEWQRVSGGTTARWHDHRTVWHGKPPPLVAANPGHLVHIVDWVVPLRVGDTDVRVTGSLDWLPPPNAADWWGGILLVAALLAGLGLVRAVPGGHGTPAEPDGRRADAVHYALVALAGVVGLCAVGYAVTVAAHNAEPGFAGLATELLNEIWPITTGLAALAAGGAVLARRAAADFAMALAGGCVALMVGFGNAAIFAHSVAPVPVDGRWARLAVATALTGALGIAGACAIRLYRDSAPALPAAPCPHCPHCPHWARCAHCDHCAHCAHCGGQRVAPHLRSALSATRQPTGATDAASSRC